jgi:hypothetical protein
MQGPPWSVTGDEVPALYAPLPARLLERKPIEDRDARFAHVAPMDHLWIIGPG